MKDKGWRIVYLPEAQIFHHTGISSATEPISSIFNFHKSCYLLYEKHTESIKLVVLPLAFLGLAMRCMFVLGVNYFLGLREKTILSGSKRIDQIEHQKNN